ncbi:MAG TPA: hypothetical protein DIW80_19380 [Gordonia polyisoprenivorans]|nr:hypothetical protein [Gordonia polyisoprenivorans]
MVLYATEPAAADGEPALPAWTAVTPEEQDAIRHNPPPPLQGTWGGKPPARRTVRLFPDYGRDWPLWENSTETWNVGYATTPNDYGLSAELTQRIRAWHDVWEQELSALDREPDAVIEARWRTEGHRIAELLAAEIGDYADIEHRF